MSNNNLQTEYLHAVEMNDVAKVASVLQLSQQEGVNLDHQRPLIKAIALKHIELTSLLLEHGAQSDDVMFHGIGTGCGIMMTLICEHFKSISQESLHTALETVSTTDNFRPVSSPLMYASRKNSHEVVKTLLQYGAELPDLQSILDHCRGDAYEQYLTCYSWHQAISSEAYLLYASKDPIQAAIDAGKAILKNKSAQQNHLQSNYEELITKLDLFVTKFFAMASSEHEIGALVWNSEDNFNDENFAQVGVLPQRIRDSLDLKYKQFISSTACTHFVLDQWYVKWKELSILRFTLWTAMVIIFQPVLCLTYMFRPFKWHRQIMKTPFVRFLVHWVSRIYFLCFIVYTTVVTSSANSVTGDTFERTNQCFEYLTSPPSAVKIIVYIWILGMTWREICELRSSGFWVYWTDFFNYGDILQLILYWTALICHMLSYTKRKPPTTSFNFCGQVLKEVSSHPYLGVELDSGLKWDAHGDKIIKKANRTIGFIRRNLWFCTKEVKTTAYEMLVRPILEYSSVRKEELLEFCGIITEFYQYIDMLPEDLFSDVLVNVKKFTICDIYVAESLTKRDTLNSSSSVIQDESYTHEPAEADDYKSSTTDESFPVSINTNDIALIGDALIGVATVLSFLALLRDIVVVAFVGPLRASFGGMISDIVRFFIVFIFVWISFALGMTQLYTTYDIIKMANCDENDDGCKHSAFTTLSDSLCVLFWSLFSPIDGEAMHMDTQFKMTFRVGEILYAGYMVVVVVVMLNALIAMMSNTYTRVEENSDVEWKLARTNLMADYMTTSATLPPPFNLLPTLRVIRNWISASCSRIWRCCCSDYHQRRNKPIEFDEIQQTNSNKTLVETIVDRYVKTSIGSNDKSTSLARDSDSGKKLAHEMGIIRDSLNNMEVKMDLILQFIQDHPACQWPQ
ncbi:transient-receptor-potential-like protein [Amphiura filiformis]|uniref:transient-receptor-potential-like protein n=1 Tax=Amphiura filiformis TaxID=82378 RepID=UPI003B21CDDF